MDGCKLIQTLSMANAWAELDAAQREYEREQYQTVVAQNTEYESALIEIETALGVNNA